MPLWLVQHDRIKVGQRVKDRSGPPMWVAEAVLKPSPNDLIYNANARQYNAANPTQNPISLVPVTLKWHMRLVGAQPSLAGII